MFDILKVMGGGRGVMNEKYDKIRILYEKGSLDIKTWKAKDEPDHKKVRLT